jgi:hypothetical protein
MPALNLGTLARPNSCSIFAADPQSLAKIAVFVLNNTVVPVPGRVRLDLTHSVSRSSRTTAARSPLERVVADNIRLNTQTVTVQGSISATPLGVVGAQIGAFGSIVRRDLREVAKLHKIQEKREPVYLVTPAFLFGPATFSIDEQHDGSNKVDLSLTFEQIRIVSPLAVAAATDLQAFFAGATGGEQIGSQPSELVTSPAGVAGGLG